MSEKWIEYNQTRNELQLPEISQPPPPLTLTNYSEAAISEQHDYDPRLHPATVLPYFRLLRIKQQNERLMPQRPHGELLYPPDISTTIRSGSIHHTNNGDHLAQPHGETTRTELYNRTQKSAGLLPDVAVTQDHQTRNITQFLTAEDELQLLLAKPTRDKKTYGNTNITHRRLHEVMEAMQRSQESYDSWTHFQQDCIKYALGTTTTPPMAFIHSLNTQGRNDLEKYKCFQWIPLRALLKIPNNCTVKQHNDIMKSHKASKIIAKILQSHSEHYRGLDGAMSIGHWFTQAKFILNRAMKNKQIHRTRISTHNDIVRFLEKQCIDNRFHIEFLVYLPFYDVTPLLTQKHKRHFEIIQLPVPPKHNDRTEPWSNRSAILLWVRQHNVHAGRSPVNLHIMPYTLIPQGQITFIYYYFFEKDLDHILQHGISPIKTTQRYQNPKKQLQHTKYTSHATYNRQQPRGMHYDIKYLELDTHHPELAFSPPNMRATLVVLTIQQHGTQLFIARQNDIFGNNDNDCIHVPPKAIYAVHHQTWNANDTFPPGHPDHWEFKEQRLIFSRQQQDYFNYHYREEPTEPDNDRFPIIPTIHDPRYSTPVADSATTCVCFNKQAKKRKQLRSHAKAFRDISRNDHPQQILHDFIQWYLKLDKPQTTTADKFQQDIASITAQVITKYQQSPDYRTFHNANLGNMPAWAHYTKHFGDQFISTTTGRPMQTQENPLVTQVDWSNVHSHITNMFEPDNRITTFCNSPFNIFLQTSIIILATYQCIHAYHEVRERNTKPLIIPLNQLDQHIQICTHIRHQKQIQHQDYMPICDQTNNTMDITTACEHIKSENPNYKRTQEQPPPPKGMITDMPHAIKFQGDPMSFQSPAFSCKEWPESEWKRVDPNRCKDTQIHCNCGEINSAGRFNCKRCSQRLANIPFDPITSAIIDTEQQQRLSTLSTTADPHTAILAHKKFVQTWNPDAWSKGYINFHHMFYCDSIWRTTMEALGITKQMIDDMYRTIITLPPNDNERNKILRISNTTDYTSQQLQLPITWSEAPWIQEWSNESLQQPQVPHDFTSIHILWRHFQNDFDIVFPTHTDPDVNQATCNVTYTQSPTSTSQAENIPITDSTPSALQQLSSHQLQQASQHPTHADAAQILPDEEPILLNNSTAAFEATSSTHKQPAPNLPIKPIRPKRQIQHQQDDEEMTPTIFVPPSSNQSSRATSERRTRSPPPQRDTTQTPPEPTPLIPVYTNYELVMSIPPWRYTEHEHARSSQTRTLLPIGAAQNTFSQQLLGASDPNLICPICQEPHTYIRINVQGPEEGTTITTCAFAVQCSNCNCYGHTWSHCPEIRYYYCRGCRRQTRHNRQSNNQWRCHHCPQPSQSRTRQRHY